MRASRITASMPKEQRVAITTAKYGLKGVDTARAPPNARQTCTIHQSILRHSEFWTASPVQPVPMVCSTVGTSTVSRNFSFYFSKSPYHHSWSNHDRHYLTCCHFFLPSTFVMPPTRSLMPFTSQSLLPHSCACSSNVSFVMFRLEK